MKAIRAIFSFAVMLSSIVFDAPITAETEQQFEDWLAAPVHGGVDFGPVIFNNHEADRADPGRPKWWRKKTGILPSALLGFFTVAAALLVTFLVLQCFQRLRQHRNSTSSMRQLAAGGNECDLASPDILIVNEDDDDKEIWAIEIEEENKNKNKNKRNKRRKKNNNNNKNNNNKKWNIWKWIKFLMFSILFFSAGLGTGIGIGNPQTQRALTDARQNISNCTGNISSLQSQLNDAQQNITSLNAEKNSLQSQLNDARQIRTLDENACRTQLLSCSKDKSSLNSTLTAERLSCNKEKSSLNSCNKEKNSCNEEKSSLAAEKSSLSLSFNSCDKQKNSIQEALDSCKNQNTQNTEVLAKARLEDIANAKFQSSSSESELIQSLQQSAQSLQQSVDNIFNIIDDNLATLKRKNNINVDVVDDDVDIDKLRNVDATVKKKLKHLKTQRNTLKNLKDNTLPPLKNANARDRSLNERLNELLDYIANMEGRLVQRLTSITAETPARQVEMRVQRMDENNVNVHVLMSLAMKEPDLRSRLDPEDPLKESLLLRSFLNISDELSKLATQARQLLKLRTQAQA